MRCFLLQSRSRTIALSSSFQLLRPVKGSDNGPLRFVSLTWTLSWVISSSVSFPHSYRFHVPPSCYPLFGVLGLPWPAGSRVSFTQRRTWHRWRAGGSSVNTLCDEGRPSNRPTWAPRTRVWLRLPILSWFCKAEMWRVAKTFLLMRKEQKLVI